MKKRIIALLLSAILLFAYLPFTTVAAGAATVVAENYSVSAGSYAYVYLRADNFVNVGVLDIELYYDSSVMSVYYVSNGTFFNSASVSTSTNTSGVVKISAMAVNGLTSTTSTYSNRMMTVCFKVNSTCPAGDYPIVVTVGHAYDNDLNPTSISGVNGVVTVKEAAAQNFPVTTTLSKTSVQESETFTVQASHSSLSKYNFASADFHIEYDRNLLKINSIELDSKLLKDGAIHSINSSNPGLAIISYASTNAVNCSNLFKITFEVIGNVDTTTDIKVTASDVYNDELIMFAPYTVTSTVTITKKAEVIDYPDLKLESEELIVGKPSDIYVVLEKDTPVAAADFVFDYDKTVFSVNSVTAVSDTLSNGALIFVNEEFSEGKIRFSYINQAGSFAEDTKLVKISVTPLISPNSHYVITSSGIGVCDINFNDVNLDYISDTNCIFAPVTKDATCEEDGFTTYSCACGESYVADHVSAFGHSYSDWIVDKNATTAEEGSRHKECSSCGDIITETIPKASHIVRKGKTLEYKDIIYVKVVFDLVDIDFNEVDISKDAGLLCFTQEEFEALDTISFDPEHALVGLAPYPGSNYYYGKSNGFFLRHLADEYYYIGYIKLPDGTYQFGEPLLYGPKTYAYNMLSKSTTKQETKQLCIALLNYISAAQKYFYEDITDAELANYELTAEQKEIEWDNDPTLFNLSGTIPTDKTVVADTSVFKKTGKNLRFQEMISLISVYQIDKSIVDNAAECGTIFWTAEQFAALNGAPSLYNFGEGKKVALSRYDSDNTWCSLAPAVAPKDMADTSYYILGYVLHKDGSVSYSNVTSYTFEQYIYNKVTNSSTSPEMLELAKRLYVYERTAALALK